MRDVIVPTRPFCTANVMALSETATDNAPWAIGGFGTARGLDTAGAFYLGEHGQFNAYHGWHYPLAEPFTTQVAMADATVRGLTSDVSDRVLESLATIAGNE